MSLDREASKHFSQRFNAVDITMKFVIKRVFHHICNESGRPGISKRPGQKPPDVVRSRCNRSNILMSNVSNYTLLELGYGSGRAFKILREAASSEQKRPRYP